MKELFSTKAWTNLGAKLRILLTDKDEWELLQQVFTKTTEGLIKDDAAGKKMRQYRLQLEKQQGARSTRHRELQIPPIPDIKVSQMEKFLYTNVAKTIRMKILKDIRDGVSSWKEVYKVCTTTKKMTNGLRWVARGLGFEEFTEVPLSNLGVKIH